MSPSKKRTTLYRFVSLRGAELTKKENQEKRFVLHPDNKTGPFFDAIKNKPANTSKINALLNATKSFTTFADLEALERLNSKFFDIANWLAQNSNEKLNNILINLKSIQSVDPKIELSLWDNLFFQVLTQKSFYVKESLMNMLLLQNILKQIAGLTEAKALEILPVLLKAKVVLPTYLFEFESTAATLAKKPVEEPVLGNAILDAQAIQSTKISVQSKENLILELTQLEKKYFENYSQAYDQAQINYQNSIKPIVDTYNQEYAKEQQNLCQIPIKEGYSENHPCNLPTIPYPDLPEFTFSFEEEFNLRSLATKLTNRSYEILSQIQYIDDCKTYQEAIQLVQNTQVKENEFIIEKTQAKSKVVAIGDVQLNLEEQSSNANFTYQLCSQVYNLDPSKVSFYISIQLPTANVSVSSFLYHLHYSNNQNNTNGYFQANLNGSVLTLTNLFNNAIPVSDSALVNRISGAITFSNGTKMEFDINPFKLIGCFTGVLKEVVFGNTNSNTSENPFIPSKFGYRQLGIADYKKVVSEICCYQAGEVAHIENVMASEMRSKVSTKTYKSEVTDFEGTEVEKENVTDTATTERFEMQTEIAKMLQEQKETTGYANVQSSYGDTSLDAGGTYASNTSKEQSNRQAVTQAKEVTQKALERVVSKTKKEKTVKITNEFVEQNTHVYDNRGGISHISGVYRFVNAIYNNQVYNYGKRVMYEFMIPQPGKLHRLGLEAKANQNAKVIEKPIDPRTIGFADFSKITETNYQAVTAKYGIVVDALPEKLIYIGKGFDMFQQNVNSGGTKTEMVRIPEKYYTTKAKVMFTGAPAGGNGGWIRIVMVTVGNSIFVRNQYDQAISNSFISVDKYKNEIPVTLSVTNFHTANINTTIECALSDEAIVEWKKEVFAKLMEAYNEQLRIYTEATKEAKEIGTKLLDSNPLFYRQFEQTVLQKNCISYLLDNSPNSTKKFGLGFYTGTTFDTHTITQGQQLNDYASFVKFMEQAFEWNLMSYKFYPYYWGKKDDWTELYQFDTNDAIFRNFMQAGMARVVVTVKPGFEDAVMHYLAFGQLWNGGQVPVLGDPLYLSIVDELKEQEYEVEETWETVLPTNLVVLQRSGVGLNAEGLPCNCPTVDTNTNFTVNDNTLTAKPN